MKKNLIHHQDHFTADDAAKVAETLSEMVYGLEFNAKQKHEANLVGILWGTLTIQLEHDNYVEYTIAGGAESHSSTILSSSVEVVVK